MILEFKESRYLHVNSSILIYFNRLLQVLGDAGEATKFME